MKLSRFAASLALFVCAAAPALAQVSMVPIQGYLSAGATPVDGSVTLDFRIYGSATGTGTLLHEETGVVLDVDAGRFVHYLGTAAPLDLSVFDGSRVWLELQVDGELPMAPRIEFGVTPYAAYSARAGGAPWSGITGVPASLADGDQDTTYTGNLPVSVSGTAITIDSSTCPANGTWTWTGTAWQCQVPTGSGYGAATGGGLALNTTTREFSVDGTVQRALSSSCPSGRFITAIAADGTVTCGLDSTGSTYSAGTGAGLVLNGSNEFGIDDFVTQRRVSSACDPGESIRAINRDGTVVCEVDDGRAHAGGDGIDINGTTGVVSVDGTVQRTLSGSCQYGIESVAVDGTVTCAARDNTTYSAGSGLSLAGNAFSVDSTVQRRTAGSTVCTGNTFAQVIDAAGNLTCGTPVDNDTTYGVVPGGGISVNGSRQFAVDTSVQRALLGSCSPGQYIQSISQTGTVVCGNVADYDSNGTITGVTTSTGLTGANPAVTAGAVTLGVDFAQVQRRFQAGCAPGTTVVSVDANGNPTCGYADDPIREMTERALDNVVVGAGPIFWSTGHHLSWPADWGLRITNGDVHESRTNQRQINLQMPPAGTQILNFSGSVQTTATAAGIPIGGWQGLWYRLPTGGTDYNSGYADYRVDNWNAPAVRDGSWVLLAFHVSQSGNALFVNADGGFRLLPGTSYFPSSTGSMRQLVDGVWSTREFTRDPFHITITGATRGTTTAIPHDVLLEYCADREGCAVVMTMHDWDVSYTWGAARWGRFYYDPEGFPSGGRTLHRYRIVWSHYGGELEAWDNDLGRTHIMNAWNCYFTDRPYSNYSDLNDDQVGLYFLNWNSPYSNNTCELTIYD